MKLPSGHRAIVDIRKLRDYCLNPNHEEGKHKARVFASVLGLRAADAEWMRDQLLKATVREDASLISSTRFGSLYVLDFELKTDVGSATIRSGWIVRHHEDFPRLTTCYLKQR
jgi:uncharacterized protein DUF6883